MLAANTAFELRTCVTALCNGIVDEFAYGLGIEALEWIAIEDLVAEVVTHESTYVITAETEGHLSKVIGSE